jgi:hypothetical protein
MVLNNFVDFSVNSLDEPHCPLYSMVFCRLIYELIVQSIHQHARERHLCLELKVVKEVALR